jgi:hypothetical protein
VGHVSEVLPQLVDHKKPAWPLPSLAAVPHTAEMAKPPTKSTLHRASTRVAAVAPLRSRANTITGSPPVPRKREQLRSSAGETVSCIQPLLSFVAYSSVPFVTSR